MTRCFVAFELAEASRAYLQERVSPLYDSLKGRRVWPVWMVRPENWHATMLFFDDLSEEEREQVWEAVAQGAAAGTWRNLCFDWQGLIPWPTPRRASMICLAAETFPGAQDWPIAPLLDEEPFCKADLRHYHSFRPHVTVLRFDPRWRKTLARDWAELAGELPPLDRAEIRIERVVFLLSTLSRNQPIYPRERSLSLL